MSTSDKIRPASQRRAAARRELYGGCRAGARGRPAAAGSARPCCRCWAAVVHWRSVHPTRAAVRTLLTSVLLCGLRSRIWDRQCGRAGVGSADIGGGPRVTLRPPTLAAPPQNVVYMGVGFWGGTAPEKRGRVGGCMPLLPVDADNRQRKLVQRRAAVTAARSQGPQCPS